MDYLEKIFMFLSILTGFISAYYWFKSSKVSFPSQFNLNVPPISESSIDTNDLNVLGNALILQGKLNFRGASFAGFSVFFLALSTVITLLSS